MPRRRVNRPSISLPAGVHRVVSSCREYFYYQEGRGTDHAGERIRLPRDPHSPEFWNAVRQAQGLGGSVPTGTINALADAYESSWPTRQRKLRPSTEDQYHRSLRVVRSAWGDLSAEALRPRHVQALMESRAATPGAANNILDALRAMCRWAMGPPDMLSRDPTLGVEHFVKGEGHLPWTPEQLAFADANFTGMLRRAYVLARYTGQRGSDIIRLGFADIDGGGFALVQKKTGARPWCPIFPELEAEMAGWEKRPGPFLHQPDGTPFTTNVLWKRFAAFRAEHPELKGAVQHGLRANAVIRLRQAGFTALQISDMVGLSAEMVEGYSRGADRKASGQAVLRSIKAQAQTGNAAVKSLETEN